MRTIGNRLIAGLLSSGLIFGPAFVRAEDSAMATPVSSGPSQGELKWREDFKKTKETKSALMVSGGILGIGGAITMVAGNLKAQSAEDVEGCTREGLFTVTCRDQQSMPRPNGRSPRHCSPSKRKGIPLPQKDPCIGPWVTPPT